MEAIKDLIQQNAYIAIGVAVVSIFIAGILFRKIKLFSIILVLIASFILYFMLNLGILGKKDIKEIKRKVKDKLVQEYKD